MQKIKTKRIYITYEQIKAFCPCWDDVTLQKALPKGKKVLLTKKKLLALYRSETWWLLSRLLSSKQRIRWANACAIRAKNYAAADARAAVDAADAAAAAARDARAARAAADAAAYAAAYAAYAAYAAAYAAAADAAAEHEKQIDHALYLLCK